MQSAPLMGGLIVRISKENCMIKKPKKHIFAFQILLKEKEYCIWFAYIIVALLSFFIGLIINKMKEFESGPLYLIAISITAPLFFDYLIYTVEIKKFKLRAQFLTRKVVALSCCGVLLFICFLFYATPIKSIIWLQFIVLVLSIILSLYMFCLNKLHLRYDEFAELDERTYTEEINDTVKELKEKQSNIECKNDKGVNIKL